MRAAAADNRRIPMHASIFLKDLPAAKVDDHGDWAAVLLQREHRTEVTLFVRSLGEAARLRDASRDAYALLEAKWLELRDTARDRVSDALEERGVGFQAESDQLIAAFNAINEIITEDVELRGLDLDAVVAEVLARFPIEAPDCTTEVEAIDAKAIAQ
jgi:hypothetical protein